MTLQSDGGCVVEGSRECCPDGSAEAAIWDIGGKKGRNTLEYCPGFDDGLFSECLLILPPLGSIYSPSCFIDVENEVFEFDGKEIIIDNSTNQLTAKAPGGDVGDVALSKCCSKFLTSCACADEQCRNKLCRG